MDERPDVVDEPHDTASDYRRMIGSGPERGVLRPRPHADLRVVGVHPGDDGAVQRARADPPVRARRRRRAGVQAARVERPDDRRRPRPHPRRRHRDAPGRPDRAQRRGAAQAAGQDPPGGAAAARPPPPRRPQHVHRVGGAGRDRRVAGPLAGHDGRHRHPQRGRRRRLRRPARRAVLLRRRQGRRRWRRSPAGTASTWRSATPTRTRRATCRCCRPSATRSPSTPMPDSLDMPGPTAGRWSTSASARSR